MYVAETTIDMASGFVTSGQFANLLWISATMEFMMGGPMKAEGTFLLFGSFSVLGSLFVGFFIKETRGLNDA